MTRRTSPAANRAEQTFPIRVKLVVPRRGLGNRLAELHQWLRDEIGAQDHAVTPALMWGGDALAVHLRTPEALGRVLEAFPDLELADRVAKP